METVHHVHFRLFFTISISSSGGVDVVPVSHVLLHVYLRRAVLLPYPRHERRLFADRLETLVLSDARGARRVGGARAEQNQKEGKSRSFSLPLSDFRQKKADALIGREIILVLVFRPRAVTHLT